MPPVAGVRPAGSGHRHWRLRSVPILYPDDVEAIYESLRRHAMESDIERLERSQAATGGRTWRPVWVEADGSVIDDIGRLRSLPSHGLSELRLRTFGYTVTFVSGPSGHVLIVDDDAPLMRRTCAEVGAIVRHRRGIVAGCLASDWGVPGFVLVFPIVASTLEAASGRSGVALAGVCFASLVLVLWLWWSHERPGQRRSVVVSRDHGDAPSPPVTARTAMAAAIVVGVFVLLAVAGIAWMG